MTTEVKPAAETARQALTAAIANGVFGPGVRLPGERALAAQLSVIRETLRQALRQLADEGVLRPSPQRGWYVTTHMISQPPNVLQSFTGMAHARGLTPTTRVLTSAQRPATLSEAEQLTLAPASPVLDLRRLRSLDGIPFSVDHTVVVLSQAPDCSASTRAPDEPIAAIKSVQPPLTSRPAPASAPCHVGAPQRGTKPVATRR